MRAVLDESIIVGNVEVAALNQVTVSSSHSDRHLSVTGTKRPIAILFRRGDAVYACNSEGKAIGIEILETEYPGAVSAFRRQTPWAD